jgi:hypothetical protein
MRRIHRLISANYAVIGGAIRRIVSTPTPQAFTCNQFFGVITTNRIIAELNGRTIQQLVSDAV